MPELPDIAVYVEALERRVLERVRMADMFVLRTAVPPIDSLPGRRVIALRRIGKRIAFGFEGGRWLVLHLMIVGRLQSAATGEKQGFGNGVSPIDVRKRWPGQVGLL